MKAHAWAARDAPQRRLAATIMRTATNNSSDSSGSHRVACLLGLFLTIFFCQVTHTLAEAPPCSAGFYSNSANNCIACPAGYFCPGGVQAAEPCPAGTENPQTQQNDSSACTACTSGYYSSAGSTACGICPGGYSCADPAAAPVMCTSGTYAPTGQTACLDCPAGFKCPSDTMDAAVSCQNGTYTTGNATSCLQCPAGHECPDATQAVECGLGFFSADGSVVCEACPAGSACTTTTTETPAPCASGQYALEQASQCTDCPKGTACADATTNPVGCASGTYANETGQAACEPCPAGYECGDATQAPVLCAEGYYSDAESTSCVLCPNGTACGGLGSTEPTQCLAGTYSGAGAGSCTPCPLGTYCPIPHLSAPLVCDAGHFANVTGLEDCFTCPSGHFSASGSNECTACPRGTYCPTQLGPQSVAIECPDGMYSDAEGSTACSLCPAGHSCFDPSVAPVACSPGTFSQAGATNCTACPVGFYCAGTTTTPQRCRGGTFSLEGQSACTECAPGQYSLAGASSCRACSSGYYTTTNASTSCSICPAGFACGDPSTSPVGCGSDSFAPAGSTTCQSCPAGYSCSGSGVSLCPLGTYSSGGGCEPCPAGTYCPSPTSLPVECPAGRYANETGRSSCLPCPKGHSCYNPAHEPQPCAAGTYSIAGATGCTACPIGTFTYEGADHCSQCLPGYSCADPASPQPCPAGTYSVADGLCEDCDVGSYSPAGSHACFPCPPGYACADPSNITLCSNGTWSPGGDVGVCETCLAGYKCVSGVQPVACTAGTYSLTGASTCTPCPVNHACTATNTLPVACDDGGYSPPSTTFCSQCPAGYACTTGDPVACSGGFYSLAGDMSCTRCPAGSACPAPELAPIECSAGTYAMGGNTTCTLCPAGSQCSDKTQALPCIGGFYSRSGAISCVECPPGFACPTPAHNPVVCSPGTYSTGQAQMCSNCTVGFACPSITDPSAVVACSPGTYAGASAYECSICPAGFYCPATDSADGNQQPCPSGTYSVGGQASCTPCPSGWACPVTDGSQNFPCLPGTYSTANATSCTACPAGEACPVPTTDATITCAPGTYALAGSTSCTACPKGKACADTTSDIVDDCAPGTYSAGGQTECTMCPPGFACPSIYDDLQLTCGAGFYSTGGQIECTGCPAGFSCSNSSAMPVACEAGFYSPVYSTECTACPAGYECSDASIHPVVCPSGTYSPAKSTSCLSCDAGYFCPPGSQSANATQTLCPVGHYCPGGGSTVACPANTYNPHQGATSAADCLPCEAGYYCASGTGVLSSNDLCSTGYYCNGTRSSCPAGTYNDRRGMARSTQCKACPGGHYCPLASESPLLCPRGGYCEPSVGALTDCPLGTFNNETGAEDVSFCQTCIEGHYCPVGSTAPQPCPAGTYQLYTGRGADTDCLDCWAGHTCPSLGTVRPTEGCATGHYCPAGTAVATDNPCPAGTFSNFHNATTPDDCSACPAGKACYAGTGGTDQVPVSCASGHYCPTGTQFRTEYPCAAGSYSNATNLREQADCTGCPKGYYCTGGGSTPTAVCPQGYYCPAGTQSATQYACPAGTYGPSTGLVRVEDCLVCPEGHYCPSASTDPLTDTPCPSGTYSSQEGLELESQCTVCDAGYECPTTGMTEPTICTPAAYSAAGATACQTCLAGYYCPVNGTTESTMLTEHVCPAGVTCAAGRDHAPDLADDACPAGYYCVAGDIDSSPQACPAGTYLPFTGAEDSSHCIPCPRGLYCNATALTAPVGDCPAGHFCPEGTDEPDSNPCSKAFYLAYEGAESNQECAKCPSGYYCPTAGTVTPTACPPGQYCPTNVDSPSDCPRGTYSNSTGLKLSSSCLPCPPGRYCETPGLLEPTGLCEPGFFCMTRSQTKAPSDGVTGDVCPPGGYCEAGATQPIPCPAGTYSNTSGAINATYCVACPPGSYCAGSNKPEPSGLCFPGYFCDGGADTPTQHEVQPGYFSLAGAYQQTPCSPGEYQPNSGASSCRPCLAAYVCENPATTTPTPCPAGGYCPEGSATRQPCPAGTYAPSGSLVNATQCTPCPPGEYCDSEGLSSPSGNCDPGYYCDGSSITPVPMMAIEGGGLCPPGFYCLLGTRHPYEYPCPRGTFNNQTGAQAVDGCTACTPGYYCETTGLEGPTSRCNEGHYCLGGLDLPNPSGATSHLGMGDVCPQGHACPPGTAFPVACDNGTFTNHTGAPACYVCPAGYQCTRRLPFMDTPGGVYDVDECVEGHWCPAGTGIDAVPCPPGTYNSGTGLRQESECRPCDPGYFCADAGAISLGDAGGRQCDGGFYCASGVDVPTPLMDFAGVGGPCPAGYYCPQGTSVPEPCPAGTFSNQTQLMAEASCIQCLPGQYCGFTALTESTGQCDPGWYCTRGAATARPTNSSGTGGICPTGRRCRAGTSTPEPCPAGTFNSLLGQANCTTCPAGHYCPQGISSFAPFPCPEGHYCPEGTSHDTQFPCPAGTFNNVTGAEQEADCQPCLPGYYCGAMGLSQPAGPCSAGWYCQAGASSPTPSINSSDPTVCPYIGVGGHCPRGYFCPSASFEPTPCEPGRACSSSGLAASNEDCAAGYVCYVAAEVASPTDGVTGEPCPAGHYCPAGSSSPTPCDPGTFSNVTAATNLTACLPCPLGHACPSSATTEPLPCQPGYYCNEPGQVSRTPASKLCPAGYSCPEGTPDRIACASGTYQSATGQAACEACPSSYVCNATFAPITNPYLVVCPQGYYCPNGTRFSTEYPCPASTFSNAVGLSAESECTPCTAGQYCESDHLLAPTGDCDAGYYCVGGASVSRPIDGVTGDVCPQGSYCPEGSTSPVACPEGSATDQVGQANVDDCLLCDPGKYCVAGSPAVDCDGGFVCVQGSTEPRPLTYELNDELNRTTGGYICPSGHFCPLGSPVEQACNLTTYQPSPGQSACLPCPAGQQCESLGLSAPEDCAIGFYCEKGTPPQPCPSGTYGALDALRSSAECTVCPAGMHCNGTGESQPSGLCDAGYLCPQGQSTATPSAHTCPTGSYCEQGATSATPCPAGTFRADEQGESVDDCSLCTPGMYCFSQGLDAPTGPCSEGYYCPESVANALPSPSNYQCPRGSACPEGSPSPVQCTDGTYQDQLRQATCKTCPAGSYCRDGAENPVACPVEHYCPGNTSHPIVCPDGTYNDEEGLTGEENDPYACPPCPGGKYCTDGRITGDCAAGYLCIAASPSPTPDVEGGAARLCDPGHYCPAGATSPTPCPARTSRNASGAEQLSQCLPCPEGFTCGSATVVPGVCPTGFYCLAGEGPTPCPVGTYNNNTGAENELDCIECPAGYICEDRGTSTYELFSCIPDHYCPQGVNLPIPCPDGSRFTGTGLGSEDGCTLCPGGYRCPGLDSNDRMRLIPCSAGTYCPAGATQATTCPGGYYCPSLSASPVVCPGSHYCPAGSSEPTACVASYYCPEGSSSQRQCPYGYRGNPQAAVDLDDLATVSTACEACPEGTYAYLDDAGQVQCEDCPASYFCPLASGVNASVAQAECQAQAPTFVYDEQQSDLTLQSSYYCLCPTGHYCPNSTALPVPCPTGTYNDAMGGVSPDDCLPCPASTYNPVEGRAACLPCGSSAFSASGATTCTCIGDNRVFSADDGECTCRSGYVFFDDTGEQVSEGDSTESCQPETLPPCGPNQILFGNRVCLNPSSRSQVVGVCAQECRGEDNVLGVTGNLGVCECASYTQVEQACNSTCQNQRAFLQCTTDGSFQLRDAEGSILDVFSTCSALRGSCAPGARITPTALDVVDNTSSVVGVFADAQYWYNLCGQSSNGFQANRRRRSITQTSSSSAIGGGGGGGGGDDIVQRTTLQWAGASAHDPLRRLRRATDNSSSGDAAVSTTGGSAAMPNPLVCIQLGQAVTFSLTRETTPPSFPRYDKNHLLNSNPTFDYGAFRKLATLMEQSDAPVNTFVHSFASPGMYVFYDNARPNSRTLVRVMSQGATCSESIQAATAQNLQLTGASKASTKQEPNLTTVGAVLGVLGCIVLLGAVMLVMYRPAKWAEERQKTTRPQYLTKGAVSPYLLAAADGKVLERIRYEPNLLEGLTVRQLFEHLDTYSKRVDKELAQHDEQVSQHLNKITQETEELHHMVKDMDVEELKKSLSDMVEKSAALTASQQERMATRAAKESELIDRVNLLLKRLGSRVRVEDALQAPAGGRRASAVSMLSQQPSELERAQQHSRSASPFLVADDEDAKTAQSEREGTDEGEGSEDEAAAAKQALMTSTQQLLAQHEKQQRTTVDDASNAVQVDLEALQKLGSEEEEASAVAKVMDGLEKQMQGDEDDEEGSQAEGGASASSPATAPFTPQEEDIMSAFMRSQLGDKFEKLEEDSDEYQQARIAAEELIYRTRREAATMGADAAKGDAQLDKADVDKERMILLQCAETQAGGEEGGNDASIRVQEIAAHYQGLRKTVRERLAAAARRRKDKRLAEVDAEANEREKQDMEALQSSPAFKGMSRDERRMRQDKIKQRAKARARQRRRAVEAEEDSKEQALGARVVKQLNQAELSRLQSAVREAVAESAGSEEDAQKMVEAFDQRRAMARQHLNDKHKQQMNRMKERLAKTRLKKQEALTMAVSEAVEVSQLDVPELEVAPESVMELDAMEKNQQRMEEELRKRHGQELQELEEKLRKEAEQQEQRAQESLEERKQQVLKEKKSRLEAEVRARPDLTEQEMNRLMKQHEEQLGTLSARMDAERSRQQDQIKAKLLQRRQKRKKLQQQRQEVELQREMATQRQETEALKHEHVREAEREAMVTTMQETGKDAETVVASVLQRRHAQELQEIRDQVEAEQGVALQELKASIQERHETRLEEREARYEKEMADFMVESASVDPEAAEETRQYIVKAYKLDIAELEGEYENELSQAEAATQARLELKLTEMLLKRKEQHYQEFAEALRDLSPRSDESAEAEQRAADLERMRQELEQQKREQFEELEQQQQDMLKELLDEHQQTILREEEEESERMNKEIAELNAVREQIKEESKMHIKKQYEQLAQLTDEDSSAVLDRFSKNQAHLSQLLDAEKQRQKAALMARRSEQAERRRQKQRVRRSMAAAAAHASRPTTSAAPPTTDVMGHLSVEGGVEQEVPQLQPEEQDQEKVEGREDEEGSLHDAEEEEEEDSEGEESEGSDAEGGAGEADGEASGGTITSERLRDSAPATGVFSRLEAIEAVLRSSARSRAPSHLADDLCKAFTLEGDGPALVDVAELEGAEVLSLEVGAAVCGWLAQRHGYPTVEVSAASKLPAVRAELSNDYIGNAYRKSMLYVAGEQRLVVRREYLRDVHTLLPLLLHSMAHISVGEMKWDDSPSFLASFHRTIGLAGQLLLTVKFDVSKALKKMQSAKPQAKQDTARKLAQPILNQS